MFFLNKSSSTRRSSREPSKENSTEPDNKMDYIYGGYPERPRNRERKQSRVRSSFFGGSKRRNSLEIPAEETENASRFSDETESSSISTYTRRRRLRKMSSKSSLASVTISESSSEGRTKSRLFSDGLFRGASMYQSSLARPPKQAISRPFNFTHITQVNPRDASQLRHGQDMGEEWNKALHRESQSRPTTAHTFSASHVRGGSTATIETARSRSRSNSAKSVSPSESYVEIVPTSPRAPLQQASPMTPPQRSSSRHCLIIPEHPEGFPGQPQKDCNVPEDLTLGAVPEEEEEDTVGHAVTTPGDSSSGLKSPGVEKPSLGHDEDALPEMGSNVPEIREPEPTPEFAGEEDDETRYTPHMFLSVRPRPISQLSQLSDTLSGNFIVPPVPIGHNSMRPWRVSRRLSAHMRLHGGSTMDTAAIDSWEQDIDWCYEHEAGADCDFDWDKNSSYAGSNFDEEEIVNQSPCAPSMLETNTNTSKSELLGIPEEPKEEPILTERRITGTFEDRLLLPPSPRFTPSSFGFLASPRARDSGFESCSTDDHSLIARAGNTTTRHRSISSSPSLPDSIQGQCYRDELYHIATQLDEHIAALNKEIYSVTPSTQPVVPKRVVSLGESTRTFSGNRSRAGSQTTCVTLCSDSDTITPSETNEAITPCGSAHNSINFAKPRPPTVSGAGYAIEGRIEKGLSYPAAAIPGVVELGPDAFPGMFPEEPDQFVHYI